MKCPRCGKHLTMRRLKLDRKWTDGTYIILKTYSCTCGYKKGQAT
ncbi:hypothetical protein LCGC14_0849530 [marine sediment metagenome]|uniref:Zinc finger Ogr/Delta-type domain-containing protein n=1 Tax=marine sediment metagenome TaxID=412755 RepID=A0A0F9PAR2_9ZZZZ